MKEIISLQQVRLMQELYRLDVPLARISEVSGISYHHVRGVLKNDKSRVPETTIAEPKNSLEDILLREKKKHPTFKVLFSEQKDIEKIVHTKDGIEKIIALASESDWLVEHSFTPSHCYKIVRAGTEWKAKLEWIIQNYQDVLKPLGFNGYHVAQIVTNAGWDKKLDWIKENYQQYQQYSFTPARIAQFFNTENWQDMTVRWHDALPVFPVLHITDNAISLLTEQYLTRLLMNGTSASEVIMLREKCTEEALNTFKDNVGNLAGIEKLTDVQEIYNKLHQEHGYTEQETKMYLVAMNKNSRGLVSWYNTGRMYSALKIALETRMGGDQMLSAEQMAAQKEIMEVFIRRAAANEQEQYFWKRLIVEYHSDIEMLDANEREKFAELTGRIKEDKQLMAELYDLLRS